MKQTPPAPGEGAGVADVAQLEAQNREKQEGWTKTPPPAADAAAAPPAPAAAAPVAPAAPAVPVEPTPEEFIEALIREAEGDTPAEVLRIPMTAKIPLKVDGAITYRPAKEALTSGMLETAFHARTTEVAEARREVEEHASRLIADRARLNARAEYIKGEQDRLREAMKSPDAMERYMRHIELMANDPEYAKTYEDALDSRERKAEDIAAEAAGRHEVVGRAVSQAADWILTIGEEPAFKSVDLDRVRGIYAQQLERGEAALDPSAVRGIFEAEAQYLSSSLTPLTDQIKLLQAQVDELKATGAAAVHNKGTQHAIDRAKAPPVATGQPAAPVPTDQRVKPFSPRELPDRNAEWAARR